MLEVEVGLLDRRSRTYLCTAEWDLPKHICLVESRRPLVQLLNQSYANSAYCRLPNRQLSKNIRQSRFESKRRQGLPLIASLNCSESSFTPSPFAPKSFILRKMVYEPEFWIKGATPLWLMFSKPKCSRVGRRKRSTWFLSNQDVTVRRAWCILCRLRLNGIVFIAHAQTSFEHVMVRSKMLLWVIEGLEIILLSDGFELCIHWRSVVVSRIDRVGKIGRNWVLRQSERNYQRVPKVMVHHEKISGTLQTTWTKIYEWEGTSYLQQPHWMLYNWEDYRERYTLLLGFNASQWMNRSHYSWPCSDLGVGKLRLKSLQGESEI